MNTTAAHMIGVMRLPSLAAALTAAGYTVITADDYKATATNIRAAFDEHGPFPIFVADSKWPGLRAWATRFAGEEGVDVVLVRTANGDGIDFGEGTVIEAHVPMSVAELLALATRAVHPSFADYKVDESGRVDGFVGDFDEQPAAPAPVAQPQPAFVAPPVTEPVFEQPVFDASQPQTSPAFEVAQPDEQAFAAPAVEQDAPTAPAAEDDPWGDNDAPFTPSIQQESVFTVPAVDETPTSPVADPVFTTPATGETYPSQDAATAAPVAEDDPWGDDAPAAPAAPVATTPADDPWEESSDAPEQPAPVFLAPPVIDAAPDEVVHGDPGTGKEVFTAPPAPEQTYSAAVATEDGAETAPGPASQADPLNDPWGEQAADSQGAVDQPVFTAPPVEAPDEAPEPEQPAAPATGRDPFQGEVAPQAPAGHEPAAPAAPVFTAPPVDQPVFTAPPAQPPVQPAHEPVVYAQPAPAAPAAPVDDVYAAIAAQQAAEAAPTNDPYIQAPSGELVPVSHSGNLPSGGDRPLGQVVISWAAKGGTGKTSTSAAFAQYAAEQGLRVILIDGNIGQGDIRTYLRIGMASLPSIYNYALTNDITQTLISPPTLSEARDLRQVPLKFGLVTTPPSHMVDESVITPEVYMRLVADARAMADLVVVDTQIVESKKTAEGVVDGPMVAQFMMPLLASGAWGLCTTDISSAGVTNTLTRLKKMAAHGVPREHLLTFINRVPNNLTFHREGLVAAVSEHSVFLGVCYADTAIPETQNSGGLASEVPQFAEFMQAALSNIRPDLQFAAQAEEEQGKTGRKRLRLFGGRK